MGFFQPSGIRNRRGFFGESAAAAFSPADVAGLKIWLKADSGVILSNGFVAEWQDQSGNGNHATEATARPSVLNAERNNLDVLDFSNECILTSNFAQTTFTQQTFFCVFKYIASIANNYARIITQFNELVGNPDNLNADYTLNNHYIPFLRNEGDDINSYINGFALTTPIENNNWYIAVGKHNGSTASLSLNGGLESSTSATLDTTISYIRICGSNVFGPNDFFNGQIAEVIFYDNALSSQNNNAVISYLNAKWDIF
jgi:hypothetical protein